MTGPTKVTITRYRCDDCKTLHETSRQAGWCCFADCAHIWDVDREVQDWGDGRFTVYVVCRNCGDKSYIEGHADEHSHSTPTPKWSVKGEEHRVGQY